MEDQLNKAMWKRRQGRQGGFTLIELLVVIAVLAVLATVVLLNVTGVKNRGTAAACATDVGTVQSAVDAYIGDNGTGGIGTNASAAGVQMTTSATPNSLNTFWMGVLDAQAANAVDYIHTGSTDCTSMFAAFANGHDITAGVTVTGS